MKTDDLISMLSTGVAPVDPHFAAKRFQWALAGGSTLAVMLMAVLYGINPNLREAANASMFWVKFAFAAALFLTGLLLTARVSIPGRPWRAVARSVLLPVVMMFLLAAVMLFNAEPQARLPMILGKSWSACATRIVLVSSPMFLAVFWAMKGLAPTQLRLAGAAAGLLAGGLGSAIYALHCPELAAPFVAVWYTAGVLLTSGLGALLGPRLLRW
jgi:hypothetical protein